MVSRSRWSRVGESLYSKILERPPAFRDGLLLYETNWIATRHRKGHQKYQIGTWRARPTKEDRHPREGTGVVEWTPEE